MEMNNGIKEAYKELAELDQKTFKKELDKHRKGDIAKILLDNGNLDIGSLESIAFSENYDDE